MRRHIRGNRLRVMGCAALVGTAAIPAMGQMSGLSLTRQLDGASLVAWQACDPPQDWQEVHFAGPDGFGSWEFSYQSPRSSICQGQYWVGLHGALSSEITPSRIHVQLTTGFSRAAMLPDDVSAVAVGGALLSYTFRVDRRTVYTLSGESGGVEGSGSLQLYRPDGTEFQWMDPESGPFSTTGEMERGEHTLWAVGFVDFGYSPETSPTSGSGTISFTLEIQAPACPCDWEGDGTSNSADFFAFLNDYFAGEADFNFDGVTNSQDFFDFLGCFFAPPGGCA